MPICGRVTSIEPRHASAGWQLTVTVASHRIRDRMINVLRAATSVSVGVFPLSDPSEVLIRSTDVSERDSIYALLDLLNQHVTIDDDTSCSHALGVHTLFWPDEEGSGNVKTYVGEVVSDAKYTWGRQQQDAQVHLADLMIDFIAAHPLLRQATHVTCPPSSQGGYNDTGLAFDLAQHIAARYYLDFINITGPQRTPRKNNRNSRDCSDVADTFEALDRATGAKVLIVDDLCGHACTINEVVRALKVVRARHVFALSGSKDAAGCNGLPPKTNNWPDWHPSVLDIPPSADLPFE